MTGSEAVEIMKSTPGVQFRYTSTNLGLKPIIYTYNITRGLVYHWEEASDYWAVYNGSWITSIGVDDSGTWERLTPTKLHIPTDLRNELRDIQDDIFGDVIGTSQAVDNLIQNLNQIKKYLTKREYESASSAGYLDISSNFIFLQRCLGGLNSSMLDRDKVVQQLAVDNKMAFEEVAPQVQAVMDSFYASKDADGRK